MIDQIKSYFIAHPDQYISGAQLSEKLGISRAAIWKHIERLRAEGYRFDAVPRKGYRLLEEPLKLNMDTIKQTLSERSCEIPWRFQYLKETESTQIAAHQAAEQGEAEGYVSIAEQQLSGRGRRGKSWFSPPGKGIWMSFIVKPSIPLAFSPQLTLLSAVALCRAIKTITGIKAGIKWPNDLLINGKKVSGILIETSAEDERVKRIVIGVGISVNLQMSDFPEELANKATSLLIEGGQPVAREALIAEFLIEFEHWYKLYMDQGFAPIRLTWEALSATLNQPVKVGNVAGTEEGIAIGLDDYGALVVKQSGGKTIKVYSGEIY